MLTGIFGEDPCDLSDSLSAAAKATQDAFEHLIEHGTSKGLEKRMLSFNEFTEIVGLEEKLKLDEKFKFTNS